MVGAKNIKLRRREMKVIKDNVNCGGVFPIAIICYSCGSIYEAENTDDIVISKKYHCCSLCGHKKSKKFVTKCLLCKSENDLDDIYCSLVENYIEGP